MTNLSKNGGRQTALDLGDSPKKGADQFDEATYRAELIAAGIPAGDAAAVAAKTAEARFTWTPPTVGEYRLQIAVSTEGDQPEIYSGNNRAEVDVRVQ